MPEILEGIELNPTGLKCDLSIRASGKETLIAKILNGHIHAINATS
jgi:hypothetical protein